MKRITKMWIIIAFLLVFSGIIIFAGVMTMLDWNFIKLSTSKYETSIYEITDDFKGISLNTDTADIVFAQSDDGKYKVECYEGESLKHSVTVENEVLEIKLSDKRTFNIGFNLEKPKITVYLPRQEYTALYINESTGDVEIPKSFIFGNVDISLSTGDVVFGASATGDIKIKTSTGNISIDNISADTIDLSLTTGKVMAENIKCEGDIKVKVSTGKVYLTDIKCYNLTSNGGTGDISLKNVIAGGKIGIERSTGNVVFDGCDGAEINVKTDTGNVTGTLLSEKVFITKTDTGRIRVPSSDKGGRCEVTTDTGDIKFEITK